MSVYFITCRATDFVKIGSSVDPHGRLRDLQTMSPLPLVLEAAVPGRHEEEFALHRRFADDRLHGEWFRITEMIEAMIAANPAPPPPPPIKISAAENRAARVKCLRWQRAHAEKAREKAAAKAAQQERRFLSKLEKRGDIHFPFRVKEDA